MAKLHPKALSVNVKFIGLNWTHIQAINLSNYMYSTASILLYKQMMTSRKYMCPLKNIRPFKADISEGSSHIVSPVQQRHTPYWKAIKNKQRQTETMDLPGCTLALCVQMSYRLSDRWEGTGTGKSTTSLYNELFEEGIVNQTETILFLIEKKDSPGQVEGIVDKSCPVSNGDDLKKRDRKRDS